MGSCCTTYSTEKENRMSLVVNDQNVSIVSDYSEETDGAYVTPDDFGVLPLPDYDSMESLCISN